MLRCEAERCALPWLSSLVRFAGGRAQGGDRWTGGATSLLIVCLPQQLRNYGRCANLGRADTHRRGADGNVSIFAPFGAAFRSSSFSWAVSSLGKTNLRHPRQYDPPSLHSGRLSDKRCMFRFLIRACISLPMLRLATCNADGHAGRRKAPLLLS
jgi:hypothetical protein